MALIQCPDCGRQVSDAAPTCPGCGRPIATQVALAYGPPPSYGGQGLAPYGYGPPAQSYSQPMADQVFLQDPEVMVSSSRIVLRGVTYVTANITAVYQWIEPRNSGMLVTAFVFVALALVGAMACSSVPLSVFCFLAAGALVAGYMSSGPKYWVCLKTSGADIRAVVSKNPSWTARVLEAINQALIATQRR